MAEYFEIFTLKEEYITHNFAKELAKYFHDDS